MNAEKLKKELGEAVKMAESIHDDMVDILATIGSDTETGARVLEAVSSLATLKWYLGHISEGVEA